MRITVLAAATHSPDRNAGLLEGAVAGSWSLGIVEQSQGEGGCWPWRDGLRGCEGGDRGGKCWWRQARQLWKQGNTAESRAAGDTITIASLSQQTSIRQLNNKATDQSNAWCTDLQSRIPAGGPLYVTDKSNTREGPQAREPSKCLNGQSYRESLVKEAFWLPATRGSKKDSDGDRLYFGGLQNHCDGDCSHEIKRHVLLGRKAMTNLDSILKSRDITLPTNVHLVKFTFIPVVMYGCESWTIKKA